MLFCPFAYSLLSLIMHKIITYLLLFFSFNTFSKIENDLSFSLIDIETGKIIAQKNADKVGPLASVSKLISLPFSLDILGPQFQFTTKLGIIGKIENNTLNGDLYLIGGADPYLTVPHLFSMIQSLDQSGIKKIKGNFYFDSSVINQKDKLDIIGLEDQTDNPSLGGLNVEFNRFQVYSPSKKTIPSMNYLSIEQGKIKTDQKYLLSKKSSSKEIWLQLPGKKKKWESVPSRRSDYFTANYLKHIAKIQGISLPSPKKFKIMNDKNLKIISIHKSLPLIEIAALAIEYSNNLMAELPYLMAKKKSNTDLIKWLKKNHSDISLKKTKLINASGLTHQNLSTPTELSLFLKKIYTKKYENRSFPSLLSIGGHSGWISKRWKTPELAFKVFAKTGSLHFVNNIAGYIFTNSGKKLAFSILIHDQKKLQILKEEKLSKKAQILRRNSRIWANKAKAIQNRLIKEWIVNL